MLLGYKIPGVMAFFLAAESFLEVSRPDNGVVITPGTGGGGGIARCDGRGGGGGGAGGFIP